MRNVFMHRVVLGISVAAAFSAPAIAKVNEVSMKPQPTITLEGELTQHRACFYDGKKYSLGAVISVGAVLLECVPEKSFETNGKLRWQTLETKAK
ncbi:DUF1496 domain-containing protein [Photobacterium ganghwense]|nr:DUF1496 domain-containing protein [Photobacterium ganghwense]PSU09504.1 DUF1496 domain-containing protein [Photobacterium ganghwense]